VPELHIARCDAPGCQSEAPLMVTANSRGGTDEVLPYIWQAIGDLTFCSWACVAAYAEARAKEGG
jgi:hypothetical protein